MPLFPPAMPAVARGALFCLLSAVMVTAISPHALAQEVSGAQGAPVAAQTPGCNPIVQDAAQKLAEAKVAAQRAAIDDAINQPMSVLQQTCFNQAAGVSASKGGDIFSGDFTSDVQPIVGSALTSLYSNFDSALNGFVGSVAGGASVGSAAQGALSSLLGGIFGSGSATVGGDSYACEGIGETWSAMSERGVKNVKAPSLSDLLNGTAPAGSSEKFTKSMQASKEAGVFDNAKAAVAALPKPAVKSYSGGESLCDVMVSLGLGGCNAQ